MKFILAGEKIINVDNISHINISKIEQLKIFIHHSGFITEANGIQTIEIIMLLKPSAFESKRLRWHKFIWSIHNLFGHPIMQLLAFFGLYKLAMWVHDKTVPRPSGVKIA